MDDLIESRTGANYHCTICLKVIIAFRLTTCANHFYIFNSANVTGSTEEIVFKVDIYSQSYD